MSIAKEYNPFIVPTGSTLTSPDSVQPVLAQALEVTFTYPFVSPTTTLVLRRPEFDNHHYIKHRRMLTKSLGGTIVLRRDQAWYKLERIALVFNTLHKNEADNLIQMVKDSLGQEIGYLDHESRQWRGYILNPGETINTDNNCSNSYQIEFQGRLA